MAEARAVLRQLVRTVDINVTSKAGNPLWRRAVFDEFRCWLCCRLPLLSTSLAQHSATVHDIYHQPGAAAECAQSI